VGLKKTQRKRKPRKRPPPKNLGALDSLKKKQRMLEREWEEKSEESERGRKRENIDSEIIKGKKKKGVSIPDEENQGGQLQKRRKPPKGDLELGKKGRTKKQGV